MAAETITIPSPSVFLNTPLDISPPLRETKKAAKRRSTNTAAPTSKPAALEETEHHAVTKKKQSKSRNGCVTCKAKRLKCDERKPSCQQCARRSVQCGGYKKDFKWRPFEETSFASKPSAARSKKASQSPPTEHVPLARTIAAESGESLATSKVEDGPPSALGGSFPDNILPTPQAPSGLSSPEMDNMDVFNSSSGVFPPMFLPVIDDDNIIDETTMFDIPGGMPVSTGSMNLMSMALTPSLTAPGIIVTSSEYDGFGQSYFTTNQRAVGLDPMEDEDILVDDIVQRPDLNSDYGAWVTQLPDTPPHSFSSNWADEIMGRGQNASSIIMFREPEFDAGSPEMLALRFDRQTCGVLSVKDGPTENPWRTLVWPLARDSPALYHAIASLTSFHTSKNQPQLRVQGIEHMRTSIEKLASGIANMRFDTAIATTLALAFSESWDQHTTTGINHIKGARVLINSALNRHRQVAFSGEELTRLRFLCNTWTYMDVIARLTSIDEDDQSDYEAVLARLSINSASNSTSVEKTQSQMDQMIDPLMGCASTLFPIIGRVANLVRRVRRSTSNSPSVISHAMVLKSQLESWTKPTILQTPEDPTMHIEHSLQTAEAYRWATLLYLHQAVPEIPSPSSAELAKKVMVYLATVPLTSRAVIVQIFPLIAAGSEAVGEEDRHWVRARWQAMAQRMNLGIIDRCAEVVKEVWDRRDAYEERESRAGLSASLGALRKRYSALEHQAPENNPLGWKDPFCVGSQVEIEAELGGESIAPLRKASKDGVTGMVDPEFTVRGRLHWLGVMKEWDWEVLLG